MLAIGNDELQEEVKEGDWIINLDSLLEGKVDFTYSTDGSISMLTLKKDDCTYMVGLQGKLMSPWVKRRHSND